MQARLKKTNKKSDSITGVKAKVDYKDYWTSTIDDYQTNLQYLNSIPTQLSHIQRADLF